MSLRIDQFNTACHVPAPCLKGAGIVDELARGRFARDLGQHLGPSLARQPAIIRIRRLSLRVIVPFAELNEDALSLRWRQEFGKALFTALAFPLGAGPVEVFRADSVAAFVATAVRDWLDGTAQDKWQYAEFESFFRLGNTQAALALICEWPRQTFAVLLHLAEQRVLARLLARFDDIALERVFTVLAPPTEVEARTLSIVDLITVARLVLAHAPDKTLALRSRAYALHLFVASSGIDHSLPSPRVLFHALLALSVLLNEDVFWSGSPRGESRKANLPSNVAELLESIALALAALLEQESCLLGFAPDHSRSDHALSIYTGVLECLGGVLHEYVQSTLRNLTGHNLTGHASPVPNGTRDPMHPALLEVARGTSQIRGGTITPQLATLDELLQLLRGDLKVPVPSAKPLKVHWVSSDWCGLFFLSGTLERLDWVRAWGRLPDFQAGGPVCLVTGLALTIAGKFDPALLSLDRVIALFAGYVDEPDLQHARRVFQRSSVASRLRVLQEALPQEGVDDAAGSWESTFERLAETLLRAFASRVRGFRLATRNGIIRSFIARQGRVRIEPERLVVFPASSPFNVALHISGMVDPVDSSLGLGGRRIEFELGDL